MGLLTEDALQTLAMAAAIFLFLVDLMHRRQRWAARYPPGPMPLPGLGNLLHVDFYNTPYSFYKLKGHFGNVFSLQLGWRPVVVLNGLAAVREALVNRSEDTADRPPMPVSEHLGFGPRSKGVIIAPYEASWKEQRRFSVSTLRNFGLGKKSLEQWVIEEADCLCAAFTDQAGRPFRPNALLNKAVCNVIASLIFARRFEYNDPCLVRLLDQMDDALKEVSGFLPEGTTLITNLSSVLKDETIWEKPFRFHPEHFLDAQGHFVKPEAFMPFSAGRRVCLGEPLARMELFLFFTRLLQRLSFSVPAGHPRPSDYGAFAVPVSPSPYELCVASRGHQ
uniref:Cytochrome P450 n=1 Tax=Castor canadensis TaxID=51338 RepID=A0A8C0XS31_CASCN